MTVSRPSLALMVLGVLGLAACAGPAEVDGMAAPPTPWERLAADAPLKEGVTVNDVAVTGKSTSSRHPPIDAEALREAVRRSLARNGMLASKPARGRYVLNVTLVGLERAPAMLYVPMKSTMRYRIVSRATKNVVFEDTIVAHATATVGDALFGWTRERLARESAIRDNLAKFIAEVRRAPLLR